MATTSSRSEGWDTALDAQTDLLRSFGTVEGRDYLNGFVKALERAGAYNGEGVLEHPDGAAEALVGAATGGLPSCDPFYVSGDLAELIDWAADSFQPEPLIATDLIVPGGFAYFSKPIFLKDTHRLQMPIRAIQWNAAFEHDSTGGTGPAIRFEQDEGQPIGGVILTFYSHRADGDPGGDRSTYPDMRIGGSDLAMEYVTLLRFGEMHDAFNDDESLRDVLTHVKVFFRLCQQTIAVPRRERVPRPVWKRARATWKDIREVVVFTLRRAKPSQYEGEEREVEWNHRWMVSGHWRNQPYVERDDQGNKRTVYRQIWIAPYIKGPDGKPLILKRRAFELVR